MKSSNVFSTSVALLVLRLVKTCIRFQQRLMNGVSQREKKTKLKDSWFLWLWWRWNKIILLSRWKMKHKGNKHILSLFCYYKKLQSSLLLQCFHFVLSQWEKKNLKTLMRNFSFVAHFLFSFPALFWPSSKRTSSSFDRQEAREKNENNSLLQGLHLSPPSLTGCCV